MLNRIDPDWIRWLGAALMTAGGLVCRVGNPIAGKQSDSRHGATCRRPSSSPRVPMPTVRHPIYTGVVLLLAGYTLAWSNWTLALIVGFIALQYFKAKAGAEERWLMERFPAYEAYMRHVPRRVL